jgi:hypothetical protein
MRMITADGCSIKREFGEVGFDIWDRWSSRSSN